MPGNRKHPAETRQNRARWLDACHFGCDRSDEACRPGHARPLERCSTRIRTGHVDGQIADEAAHGPDGGHVPNTRRMVEGHAPLTISGAFADGRPVRRVDAHARDSASVAMIASMLPLLIARSMRWFMRWMDS